MSRKPVEIDLARARQLWLAAQRLDRREPFGGGPQATKAAVEHLGYVQIDTINVIERCHHHILFSRIPGYRREHLRQAQTVDKTVFEYWTHALAYIPTRDIRFFLGAMKRHREAPATWFGTVERKEVRRVLGLIRREGPLSIRDIEDEVLVEKHHPWASRKPSKRALQLAFFNGEVTISERTGMLRTYELIDRHFGWERRPRAATERQVVDYMVDRALRSQAIVSLDSICHLDKGRKPAVRRAIEARVRRRELVPVALPGKTEHWASVEALDARGEADATLVHILSPFDPLVIQRRRLALFFGYDHLFEAYVPKDKRKLGYFALPVLIGDAIVAALDLKAERSAEWLSVQAWTWIGEGNARRHKRVIEEELDRFARFQFQAGAARDAGGPEKN